MINNNINNSHLLNLNEILTRKIFSKVVEKIKLTKGKKYYENLATKKEDFKKDNIDLYMENSFNEDKYNTIKLLLYARDCRDGKGEKRSCLSMYAMVKKIQNKYL